MHRFPGVFGLSSGIVALFSLCLSVFPDGSMNMFYVCVFFSKLGGSERKFSPISQVNFPFLYNHLYFVTDITVCHKRAP